MPVPNSEIAEAFDEMGDLLEIQGGSNPFRVRAYRTAARVVGSWPASLSETLKKDGELPKMPGVGTDLSGKIRELIETRKMSALEGLRKKIPDGLRALLKIQGLGPKRVGILREKLGIRTIAELERAVRSGRVAELAGFGEKTQQRILTELGKRSGGGQERVNLVVAEQVAGPLLRYLREASGVMDAVVAGSFRRRKESVGDLDILVSAKRGASAIRKRFLDYEDRAETLSSGETRSAMVLRSGLQVDLRIVPPESFGAALYYFTGSKAHNIAVRALGQKRGLKINEYGVFRGSRRTGGRTEEEVFKSVGLPWIEPVLRENSGEIEAARAGKLPKLVTVEEIRGDLHAHSVATDGRQSIAEMAEAARARGYEYLAITDHTRHLSVTRGLDAARLLKQIREIDRLNEKFARSGRFRILKGSEVDILEDGSLDLPDEVLRRLDLTVCSVHFKFDLPRRKQTERILRAMDHPAFTILGHPSGKLAGRLGGSRRPMDIDLEKIMLGARERGCYLELNSQPDRLDLSDMQCMLAKEVGVKVAISTDAHSANDLGFISLGVDQARRGWLEAGDVLNTRSLGELQKTLRHRSC